MVCLSGAVCSTMKSCCFLLLCLLLVLRVRSLTLDPDAGGYQDLVVAIASDALPVTATQEEKETLVGQCKTLIQALSEGLLERTGLQIVSATVLVPREWNFTDIPDIQLSFGAAEVHVDAASELHGDLPYTHQPHPCGQQGRYIHVTPAFVAAQPDVLARTGTQARAMAHEWAQFRWGVREEYGYPGDPRYPYFHRDPDGNWVPTGSNSTEIGGVLLTTSQQECTFSGDGEPSSDCRFFPELTASASIMHFHHLEPEAIFSTQDNNNRLSPSKQGAVCGLRSAWEVISTHPDIQQKVAQLTPRIAPTITVAQPDLTSASALYIVLDLTANVDETLSNQILDTYKQGLDSFFSRSSDSMMVCLQSYSGKDDEFELEELVPLDRLGNRRAELMDAVANLTMDPYSVGRDSQAALLQIAAQAKVEQNGERSTLFFTQNARGTAPEGEAIQELQEANLGVVGVGFKETANAPNLFTVCSSTGGRFFLLLEPYDTAFEEAINFAALGDQPSTRLYQVALEWHLLMANENVEFPIYLEQALGYNAKFALTKTDRMTAVLTDPMGNEVDLAECLYLQLTAQYICSFEYAQSGDWLARFACTGTCYATGEMTSISVTSYIRPDSDYSWPTLETWTSGKAGVVDISSEDLQVYAELRQKYRPLIGASVTATLEVPNLARVVYDLRDDGRDPDIIAGDGVYVAKMQPISSSPMFLSVYVSSNVSSSMHVERNNQTWGVLPIDQGSSVCCGSESDPTVVADDYKMERTLNLSVVVRVLNFTVDYQVAPQVIEDLAVERVRLSQGRVLFMLTWTAPQARDGSPENKVSSYDLYFTLDSETILDHLNNSNLVTTDLVTDPTDLDPLPPGQIQTVDLFVDVDEFYVGPVFFRIISHNSQDDMSPPSRVTYTYINVTELSEETTTSAPTTPSDGGDDEDGGKEGLEIWFLILMVIAGLGLLGVLIAAILLSWQKIMKLARRETTSSVEELDPERHLGSEQNIEEITSL